MLTKEQLTDAHEQGLSVILNGRKIQIVAIIMDVVAVKSLDSDKIIWLHLDSFFKGECIIEQPKPKIDFSILKEGNIYYLKSDKSSYLIKFLYSQLKDIEIIWDCNYALRNNCIYREINGIKGSFITELRLPTESELELFYSKFPDLKPKPKIDFSILKEGQIYYAKANTSEIVFKHKGRNTKIHSYAMYFISYNKTFTNYSMCNIDSITELRLPTKSELELFYSKFPDLKPKPKYNGRAVKCDTVEQANWLLKVTNFDYELTDNNYLVKIDGGFCSEIYAIRSNYEIISFSDYCKENNLTEPKWIQGFEIGKDYNDVVMVSDNLKSWHINILQSVNNGLQPFNCGFHSWKYCRYLNKNEINEIKFID